MATRVSFELHERGVTMLLARPERGGELPSPAATATLLIPFPEMERLIGWLEDSRGYIGKRYGTLQSEPLTTFCDRAIGGFCFTVSLEKAPKTDYLFGYLDQEGALQLAQYLRGAFPANRPRMKREQPNFGL